MSQFQFLHWIKNYKASYLSGDLTAGITVGVMLIPQGMAYAMLAGMPPIFGLYCATIPLIIYAFLGSSPQLAVGPVALVSLLVASSIGLLAETTSESYILYAVTLSLMVGIILFAMGVFRLGFLVNFLSHPVIAGFISAAAIIIGVSQLKHIFGIDIPRSSFSNMLSDTFSAIGQTNPCSLAIGITTMAFLFISKKIDKRIPGALIVVILSIFAVKLLNLESQGLKLIGEVPAGLPAISIPSFDMGIIKTLLPIALTISFIGFMESIAVAKAIQKKHKDYHILPNQELIALGAANIFGSFFQAYPVVGGFGRSAVNDQAGAKSGLASIISAIIIILTLLFFTDLFQKLPMAVLAAIIIVAVIGLIDFKEAQFLWKNDKRDFSLFLITAIATLVFGIEEGILAGVLLSIGLLIYRVSNPHSAVLGKVPGSAGYRNIDRFDHLKTEEDILIIRFDGRIYFANAPSFRETISTNIERFPDAKFILIDASSINGLDSTAVHMLQDIDAELQEKGKSLCFASVKGPIRDIMHKYEIINEENAWKFFLSIDDGVQALTSGNPHQHTSYVTQRSN